MHGLRADLDFNGPAGFITNHRVQRLVTVGFGPGNVIVKLAFNRRKKRMHKTQRGVATIHIGRNDPQRADIKHLVKVKRLAAHFFDYAVNVFRPALYQRSNTALVKVTLKLPAQRLHEMLTLHAFFVEQLGSFFVGIGLQKTKGQVFHFPFDLPDAEPIGQRRKHMQ